ncbi:hypothetical protein [Martelella mangrovi]|uniref:Uncharacterized protein n=1 Tax=Martelella mangrovi TaxID=1397477 RepID=A0ABV2IEW7_9HYPH
MKLNAIFAVIGRFRKPIFEYLRSDRMPRALLGAGTVLVAGPSWPTLVAFWYGTPLREAIKLSAETFSLFVQLFGIGLALLGIVAWISANRKKSRKTDFEKEKTFHRAYGSLLVGEKQVWFKEVYRRPAPVNVIDALMQHGLNPMLLCADFKRGGDLVELDGDWFSLKNRHHKRDRRLSSVMYFACGIVSVIFLGIGTSLLTHGIISGNRTEATAGVMAFGLMLATGGLAGDRLPRIAAYAAAERVVNEGPATPYDS